MANRELLPTSPPHSQSPPLSMRNSPGSYELAAKEIEQEKQMVAALKRLLIGHLMSPDPDLPPQDPLFLFFLDPDSYDDSRLLSDGSPLSRTPSGASLTSALLHFRRLLPDSDQNATRLPSLPLHSPQKAPFLAHSSPEKDPLPNDELLWVPANLHPEVNPQQFKHHVRTTIDDLLERKLSRSQSASRLKRLLLSLSSNHDGSFALGLDEPVLPERPADRPADPEPRSPYPEPSLRKLTSELQAMSRSAGMDSSDAVTLAFSLSSSSLGYSEIEKEAFSELGNAKLNAADRIDLGDDPALKGDPYRPLAHPSTDPYPHRPGPDHRPYPGAPGSPAPPRQDNFALRRSRRVDYRKGPTHLLLGSQLQNNKAEKLAELRHNLMPHVASSKSTHLSVNTAAPDRTSMHSINPRSSQLLFSYKTPLPGQQKPRKDPIVPVMDSRISPYPSVGVLKTNSVSHGPKPGPLPTQLHLAQLFSPLYSQGQPHPGPHPGRGYPRKRHGARTVSAENLPGAEDQGVRKVSGPEDRGDSPAPRQHFHEEVRNPKVRASPHQRRPHYPEALDTNIPLTPGVASPQASHFTPAASPYDQSRPSSKSRVDAAVDGRPHSPSRLASDGVQNNRIKTYNKRDKTRELNQDLDLLRDEINQFKESLAKTEKKEQPFVSKAPDVNEFSFDLTTQDVSYEDTLGIEEEVLSELGKDTIESKPLGTLSPVQDRPDPLLELQAARDLSAVVQLEEEVPLDSLSDAEHRDQGKPLELVTGALPVQEETPIIASPRPQLSIDIVKAESLDLTDEEVPSPTIELEPYGGTTSPSGLKEDIVRSPASEKSGLSPVDESSDRRFSQDYETTEKRKSKKNWPWSKEREASQGSVPTVPVRSVSSPELMVSKRNTPVKEESKENVITKLFKRRRSSSGNDKKIEESEPEQAKTTARKRVSKERSSLETVPEPIPEEKKEDRKVRLRLKSKLKNIAKKEDEVPVKSAAESTESPAADERPKSTLEVQEKLKKSIKRYSRPNQPIEFTDSAFGFPLPPPSQSTLIMIDYRFPVHVERAIYRLSHLKLANPKRSLREQVVLSNFMYAYLNLVDHTLHLEQMTLEEYAMEQPETDGNLLGDQDQDTDFEADTDLEQDYELQTTDYEPERQLV